MIVLNPIFKRFFKNAKRSQFARKKGSLLFLVMLTLLVTSSAFLIKDFHIVKSIGDNASIDIEEYRIDAESRYVRFRNNLPQSLKESIPSTWKQPKNPTGYDFKIDKLGPINDDISKIFISGLIQAQWVERTVSPYSDEYKDDFPDNILKNTSLNFSDHSGDNIYEMVGSVEDSPLDCSIQPKSFKEFGCPPTLREVSYRFSGNFDLKPNLYNFPFDTMEWRIELLLPGYAMNQRPAGGDISFLNNKETFGSYILSKQECLQSGKNFFGNTWQKACWDIRATPIEFQLHGEWPMIAKEDSIEWKTSVGIFGTFKRAAGTGFFRYLFPLCVITLILLIIDFLSIIDDKELKDVKLLAAPTVILALIFLQSEYHSILPQLSYITYLDKLYYVTYVYCIGSLLASIYELKAASSVILRVKKRRLSSMLKLRIFLGLMILISPFLLLYM